MKAEDYKNEHYFLTAKLSDITRNLSFMGFGVVWILIGGVEQLQSQGISSTLIVAMMFLSLSLFFDLLQYVYQSIFTYCRFKKAEKEDRKRIIRGDLPGKYNHSRKYNSPSYLLAILKVASMFTAYIMLIKHLIKLLL